MTDDRQDQEVPSVIGTPPRLKRGSALLASHSSLAGVRTLRPLHLMRHGLALSDIAGRGGDPQPTGGGGRAPIRPEENFATALLFLDGIMREVSEDGWVGRRQDPLAKGQVGGNIALTAGRSPKAENRSPTTGKALLVPTVIGLLSSVLGLRSSIIGDRAGGCHSRRRDYNLRGSP
jgi:hypothetical protein